MNNDARNIMPGDRVKAFDSRRFIDDVTTPPSVTMRPATVVCRYGRITRHWTDEGKEYKYPDLVDICFDGDLLDSHGHFTNSVVVISHITGREL